MPYRGNLCPFNYARMYNKGNSGSPVIEVKSGKVIGLIIQEIPAPLFSGFENLPMSQNSGIALAAPAEWVIQILKKHNVPFSQ